MPPVVAPDAPAADPGTASALVNGQKVPLTIKRVNNRLEVTTETLQIRLGVRDENGNPVSLDAEGNAVIDTGSQIEYSVSGARQGEELEAWLLSDPIKLATVVIGDNGRVDGVVIINDQVPYGPHRLVFDTLSSSGEEVIVSFGVIVGTQGQGVPVSWVILGILVTATIAGLIVPATRRRRRVQKVA